MTEFEPEQIFTETDLEKFEIMVNSLLENAIKYSPNGGEVRISACLEPSTKDYPDGTVLIQVNDQGMGISKKDLKSSRLSDWIRPVIKKRTTKVPVVGFMWVSEVIAIHHGAYRIDSKGEGKGTTFFVRIPVKQPNSEERGNSPYDAVPS